MKTKISFIRFCWTLSAFVICLSSTEGQTLDDEQPMGTGWEPAMNCDRRIDPLDLNKRIQLNWMDPYGTPPAAHHVASL